LSPGGKAAIVIIPLRILQLRQHLNTTKKCTICASLIIPFSTNPLRLQIQYFPRVRELCKYIPVSLIIEFFLKQTLCLEIQRISRVRELCKYRPKPLKCMYGQ